MTTSVSRSRSSHSWFLLAAGIWLLVLLGHSWYPFDFDLTSEAVWSRLTRISLVPFGFYYWYAIYIVNPLEAVHETLLNFALAVPLGFFMRLAWPDAGKRRAIVAATIALLAMEAGQSFLPMRFPDVTDALVGAIGALVGAMMAAGFASRQHKSPAATALQTNQPATRDDSGTGRRVSSWE
jgi:glycopeptide antibiotics resistance protein